MTETQLFYLTMMVGLFVLYLIISKICEAYETKYKAFAFSNMNITDISENQELQDKLMQAFDNQNNPGGED